MDEHTFRHHGHPPDITVTREQWLIDGTPVETDDMLDIATEEILRLAGEAEELNRAREDDADVRSVLFTAGQQAAAREEATARENALLRRERSLLIELEKVRCGIIGDVAEGREVDSQLFRAVGRLNDALAALHLEASGGLQRPPGVPCACVLCQPEGLAGKFSPEPGEIVWSHQSDPEHFGEVLPCGDPSCRQPNCPNGRGTVSPREQPVFATCNACGDDGDPSCRQPNYPNGRGTVSPREQPVFATCNACGDDRLCLPAHGGRCHDCISAGRRGKVDRLCLPAHGGRCHDCISAGRRGKG